MSDLLKYKLVGDGPNKVIILHDWSVSCEGDYEYALPFFDLNQLTIAFVDVRGYGLSKNIKGSYNTDEITADVDAVAAHLGWAKFSVVGHSMTGMAVQKIMSRLSAKVEKVVATVPVPASGFPLDDDTFGFFAS
ncbi:MAG: alpha/beta hydrolase, partial [Paracoccaceae bacterium]|nr:alpha/beta hydrolase [Paracoccaceae bacterium]